MVSRNYNISFTTIHLQTVPLFLIISFLIYLYKNSNYQTPPHNKILQTSENFVATVAGREISSRNLC